MYANNNGEAAFLQAACVPVDGSSHTGGSLVAADAMLAANASLAHTSIYTAAVLGEAAAVQRFLAEQPALATAKGGPHNWDALTYLCFSSYLRLAPERNNGHLQCARALLEAGADANAAWPDNSHQPHPVQETVLYGAAGIAHNAPLARLLLQYGADPNDDETTYHTPETYDNSALQALLDAGRLTAGSLATLLLRKTDWHDYDGIVLLLKAGAHPDYMTRWHRTPLQSAVLRDNDLPHVTAMMDHGGNPLLGNNYYHGSAVAMAARRGRGDLLRLFEERGVPFELTGADALIAACALNDAARARDILTDQPALLHQLLTWQNDLLATFSGTGNAAGVGLLLDLGVDVHALCVQGDPYFGVARNSTALHIAAWRARHSTVELLLHRGAAVNTKDADGRTPLHLAILACTDSYWSDRRSPQSVKALLDAGATTDGVAFPTGYDAIDALLAPHCGR